jgi:hypothetical protein
LQITSLPQAAQHLLKIAHKSQIQTWQTVPPKAQNFKVFKPSRASTWSLTDLPLSQAKIVRIVFPFHSTLTTAFLPGVLEVSLTLKVIYTWPLVRLYFLMTFFPATLSRQNLGGALTYGAENLELESSGTKGSADG